MRSIKKNLTRSLKGGSKYSSFKQYKRTLSSKNNKHDMDNIKPVKLPKKPSFAAKLCAFLLEGVNDEIFFSKKTGFSGKHHQVYGVLPFLHINIKENEFKKFIDGDVKSLSKRLSTLCNSHNLNNTLSKVGFNCNKQSKSAVIAMNMAIIDSINNRYHIRKNGRRNVEKILGIQTWQHKNNNKQIPAKSLNWGK